ncbi:MAG: type II toxin-antitoxin system VapC family toxin [Proteobacteria bacterium]|nr:type II toxin-antitoxin system VapC family toxin [Pseudomonadota bacterium]
MIIVLDSSAAVEIVLGREYSRKFSDFLSDADWVVAPDVFVSEVANVFWKYFQFDDLPLETCEHCIEDSIGIVDEIADSKDLYREAFAFSCMANHPIYDTLFLILARRLNGYLLTLDNKLSKLASKHSVKTITS